MEKYKNRKDKYSQRIGTTSIFALESMQRMWHKIRELKEGWVFMKTVHKIIIGDSRKMREIKNASAQLIVTSPPYWQLKDYGSDEQIGFNHSYEEYINNLNLVWNECHRVMENGCRLCVNIGYQFARSVYYGR